jgi:glutamate synthase domain-containing protein 2
VPEDKAARVANYARGLCREVETIAHSVGVAEPRQMRRSHVRLVQANGNTVPMSALYPGFDTRPDA